MKRFGRILLKCLLFLLVFLICTAGGTMTYFHYAPPSQTCLSCHEMQGSHDAWAKSAHASVDCRTCHGGSLTTDFHALEEHANRLVGHFSKLAHDSIRLNEQQIIAMNERCGACHASELAGYQAGGHAVSYATIFLDPKQNQAEQLNSDCLRCHGMFFVGTTQDLVEPIDKTGPWTFKDPEKATQPAVPCLSCHQVHAEKSAGKAWFYARRQKEHIALSKLPVPHMFDKNGHEIRVATDPGQRLCVQCHAPTAFHVAGSSDDRTPTGVHEGLSCSACHAPHSQETRTSCARCHPAMSNCGLDVMTMDTTFKSAQSKLNIHFVACTDCHADGRPVKSPASRPATQPGQ